MSNTPYQTINRKKEIYSLILNFPLFIFPFPILHFPISHSTFSQNWFPLRKEGFCIWWTVPERTLSRLRVTTKASSYNISELSHFQSDKQTKSGNIVWSKIKVSKPEFLRNILKAVGRIYIENFFRVGGIRKRKTYSWGREGQRFFLSSISALSKNWHKRKLEVKKKKE